MYWKWCTAFQEEKGSSWLQASLSSSHQPLRRTFSSSCPFPYELCANSKKDALTWACRVQVTDPIPLERKEADLQLHSSVLQSGLVYLEAKESNLHQ